MCTNCGTRDMECWGTCNEQAGYCNQCDSKSGKKGACCKLDESSDPQECQDVPTSSFYYQSYHMCVLVPGNKYHFIVI